MPSTPSHLKLGFQRNAYNRVSFGKSLQEKERKNSNGADGELLQGCKGEHEGIISGVDYINLGLEDQMEVYGYKRHTILTAISWLFILISLGMIRLVFHWWPQLMLFATHKRCPLSTAEKVLIVERYQGNHKCYYVKTIKRFTVQNMCRAEMNEEHGIGDGWKEQALLELTKMGMPKLSVHTSSGIFKEMETIRLFDCKKQRYVWDQDKLEFYRLCGLDNDIMTLTLHKQIGLSLTQQYLRRCVYGQNEIIVPLRGIMALLFLEVLNPFYVFQIFSFILWFADDYICYAFAIFLMSAISITMTVIQTRNNQHNLHNTVHKSDVVSVLRAGTSNSEPVVSVIPTEQLVPGDLMLIPSHGCNMHCDAVLLAGNCIVNESMLTGESVPVTKTPLPNSSIRYNDKEHARHTLFCGTKVIQTRYYGMERVYAVVIRTGYSTSKGSLVRSILYPPPVDFKFERDSYKFVQLLAAIASIGFIYTVVTKAMRGMSATDIALEAFDLITIVVPPALPAAMTVGRMYAQSRLQKHNIYCISPRTINVSGSINCVCFDKTGTLTEDGLDLWGVVPVKDNQFHVVVKHPETMQPCLLLTAMVTCHSLTIIDEKLSGDPLDLKMFESTGWILEEPEVSDDTKFDLISPTVVKPPYTKVKGSAEEVQESLEIGIVRQFPFSSSLQRMSVISRRLGAAQFSIFCKGSPEMIQGLCRPETIPNDYIARLEEYTQEGYRVLGMAYRDLPCRLSYPKMQRLSREEVEADLCFLGFVVLENRLKPETTGTIAMLRGANIRTVMVTGDNMLTALSVARDCGIVPLGQRVIMIHSTQTSSDQVPQLYYVQTQQATTPDTLAFGDFSQMTGTDSIASLDTIESVTATNNNITIGNGTAHNSLITEIEMPVDNTICGPHDLGSATYYSFALTGSTWSIIKNYFPELVARIVTRGAVFSRMSPDQKQQLIQELQVLGYYVAMCGDGANDCGALKAAHAGISLSEAEASVASPFTSRDPNIECIVRVIREGRAALITSFGIFKYMAAYSLIQFVSVMMLYSIDSNLTDIQFLYIDLFVITTFAFMLGRIGAYEGPLVSEAPQTSLMSLAPILSLIGQMVIAIGLQFTSFYTVQQFDWFVPFNRTAESDSVECYENYALFTISSMQYVILAVVFSKGAPYRQPLSSNWSLLGSVVAIVLFTLYLIVCPAHWIQEQFELKLPPATDFRMLTVIFCCVNFVFAAIHEYFICDYLIFHKLRVRRKKEGKGLKKYLSVERELCSSLNWPALGSKPPMLLDAENFRPPRSPATVTMYSTHNNSVFNFPTPAVRASDIRLDKFLTKEDDEFKYISDVPNIATLPRRISLADSKKWANTNVNNSCHSVVQVHQSEDSLSGYLTPPESLHSLSHEIELDKIS